MENKDSNENHTNTRSKLNSASPKGKKSKKERASSDAYDSSDDQKKKSFIRSWRSSGPVARWTLIWVGIGAFAGIGYLVLGIVESSKISDRFHIEHRPGAPDNRRVPHTFAYFANVWALRASMHSRFR
jgi:hypothetical protein